MGLTRIAVARPLFILMFILALIILGAISFTRLGVELFPSLSVPTIAVVTTYPGAAAADVEELVTRRIEDAVSGLNNVDTVASTSSEGVSSVVITFNERANTDTAAIDIERRVAAIRGLLPEDAGQPAVQKFDISSLPIMTLTLSGDRPASDLYRLADEEIAPRLTSVNGVAQVAIAGGQRREIQIQVDPNKLRARNVTLTQISAALGRENQGVPGGSLPQGDQQLNLRINALLHSISDVEDLVVSAAGASPVRIRDVADVVDTFSRTTSYTRLNGQNAISLSITKAATANEVNTADGVRAELARLKQTLPPAVALEVRTDNSEQTRESLAGVQRTLIEAIILTGIVLFAFLHTFRSTIIVIFAIPTALISTFIAMWIAGFTLNIMSMLGLVLVIGVLVDDSIVVIENIFRHLKLGETPYTAALKGRSEIGLAAIAITLVDIVIFAPVGFLSGTIGGFFKQFALVIAFAVAFSLFISFTLTPMLASRWLREDTAEAGSGWQGAYGRWWNRHFERLERGYRRALGWALRHRWLPPLVAAVSLVASVALVPLGLVKFEFVPVSDNGTFTVSLELPPGSSLTATDDLAGEVERRLDRIPEVEQIVSQVGSGGGAAGFGASSSGVRNAQLTVTLVERNHRQRSVFDVVGQVNRELADIPATVRTQTSGFGGGQQLQVRLSGENRAVLSSLAAQVADMVRTTPGVGSITNGSALADPEIRFNVDRDRLTDHGLTADQVANAVRTAVQGSQVTQLRTDDAGEVPVRLIATEAARADVASLQNLPLTGSKGGQPVIVRLGQVTTIEETVGATSLTRRNRQPDVTIGASLAPNVALGQVTGPLDARLAELRRSGAVPPGYRIEQGGQAQSQSEAISSLGLALVLALVLEYMVLVALYESLIYPFVTMFALPVAIVGALIGLAVSGNTLNLLSGIGLIVLMGLVGKNGILLVDYTNHLRREEGLERREALLQAGPTRLRPILMTSAALVFGLMPIALKLEEGSEFYASIGALIIGGMLSSTLLSLFVVPTMYTYFDDFQNRVIRVFRWRPRRRRARRASVGESRPVPGRERPVGLTE